MNGADAVTDVENVNENGLMRMKRNNCYYYYYSLNWLVDALNDDDENYDDLHRDYLAQMKNVFCKFTGKISSHLVMKKTSVSLTYHCYYYYYDCWFHRVSLMINYHCSKSVMVEMESMALVPYRDEIGTNPGQVPQLLPRVH